jgi:hypothetical protein
MRRSLRKALMLVAAATSLIFVGGGVATASASTALLHITGPNQFNQYKVKIEGDVGQTPRPGSVISLRLWGEDRWFNNVIYGPFNPDNFVGRDFWTEFYVYGGQLDEDYGGEDEIYADIRVYDANGRQYESGRTGTVRCSC